MDTRSRTTSMNLYYVAISRARQEARIYTNSAKELPVAIARRYSKTSTMELQKERKTYTAKSYASKSGVAGGKPDIASGKQRNYQSYENKE